MEDKLQNNLPEAEIDTTNNGQADTNVVDTQIEAQADTNNDGLVSQEERFAFETRTDDQETFPEGPMGMAYRSEESIAKNIPNYKQYKWYQSPMEEGHEGTEYFYTLGEKIEDFIEQNPEEAADVLEGDLKKEAEQAIDGGKDAEVNNEVVEKEVKKLGSFLPDIPTKEVSQEEYNEMPIDDLAAQDELAMKGEGDYITVAKELGLDEEDLYYFEDPSFIENLTDEQKEEVKNEPDKEKKKALLGDFANIAPVSLDTGSNTSVTAEGNDIIGDGTNTENASTPLTSGVSPTSPSFASGGSSTNVSAPDIDIETERENSSNANQSQSVNDIETAERDSNEGSMNGANLNEHLDDTLDTLSFDDTKHEENIKTNEQFELDGAEGHTSNSNEGVKLPKLETKDDVKKAIIGDSKNWEGENSGSKFLPFRFTVVGNDIIVSKIGTARKEEFDVFAKDEPGSINQIKAVLSNIIKRK